MLTMMRNEKLKAILNKASFWLAILVSYAAILLFMTRIWQLVIIPPVVGSLLFIKEKASLGWWSGFIGVALATLTILIYFVVTQPAMKLMDLLMAVIIGSSGLGFVGFLLTIVIYACIGGFGGLIGFAIQALVLQRKDEKKPEDTGTEA